MKYKFTTSLNKELVDELKIQAIKENGEWDNFKDRYLELKNMHLRRGDGVKSFSIFLEALNEFYR